MRCELVGRPGQLRTPVAQASRSLAVSAGRLMKGECDERTLMQPLSPKRRMNSLSDATVWEWSSVQRMLSWGTWAVQDRDRTNGSSVGASGRERDGKGPGLIARIAIMVGELVRGLMGGDRDAPHGR